MGQDSQTVPVTVTVAHTVSRPPDAPSGPLPFTGAPLEALVVAGLTLAAAGTAVVAAVRRRSTTQPTRSPA